jgi:VWFA-related protein
MLAAQEAGFVVESRLVSVPAIVTDQKGRSVNDLEAADFVLLDNGRSQQLVVDTLSTGTAPIALVIAVQSSGISVPVLEKVRKIGAMIQPLVTGERGCAGLVSFSERVQWHEECTANADRLSRAFYEIRPGESKSARMLDAVHQSIARLRKRPNVRRVLFLVSESRDRGSESELNTVLLDAQAAGVTIYAATYSAFKTGFTSKASKNDPVADRIEPPATRSEPLSAKGRVPIPPPEERVDILGEIGELVRLGKVKTSEVLTRTTGGITFSFARQKGLETAIEKLGSELHSQYILSFTPVGSEPGFHRLEVLVPARPHVQIRARPSYWSVQSPRG